MNCPPFRAFVWLIVCMLFSFTPLGCHPVKVRHAMGWPGQPQLPEYTAQQLEECGELIQEGIDPVRHPVDAKVVLDENGRVLDVTTAGEPNPDVGMCIRVALRGMKVDKDVIHEAMLRRPPSLSSWPNAETQPNPKYLGEVVIVTVVVVVFTEVIIETVAVALGVAVTATVVAEATKAAQVKAAQAKAAQATAPAARKPHQPVAKKWLDNGGSIDQKADGTTTYTRADGVAVTYDKDGFPDFTPYRHPTVKDVQIEFTGDRDKDNKAADKAARITKEKRDAEEYTWHHHQDGRTMQLIKRDVHAEFFHTGGISGTRRR